MDNKKIAGMLLRTQMDDLKDAEMLLGYAEAAEHEGDSAVANAMYNRAKNRLNQMLECKRTIESVMSRAAQEAAMNGESFSVDSIYKELYDDYITGWEEKIRNRMV
jgi:hypothetical protein